MKLKEPELFDGYSEAEDAARKEHALALHYRDRTTMILANAQSVLEVARQKKFPGREPTRQPPFPPGGSSPTKGGPVQEDGPGRQKEDKQTIDGLLSLGPLRDSIETNP